MDPEKTAAKTASDTNKVLADVKQLVSDTHAVLNDHIESLRTALDTTNVRALGFVDAIESEIKKLYADVQAKTHPSPIDPPAATTPAA